MPATDKAIWLVCKDPGGTNVIVPVFEALKREGMSVVLIPNGKAVDLIKSHLCSTAEWARSQVASDCFPRALVTSMCSQGGLGRDLIPQLRCKCPIVALQDFWGGGLWGAWADLAYRPDWIVVNDDTGAKIVQDLWCEYQPDRIKAFSSPALDKYAAVETSVVGKAVREKLGMQDRYPIVLFAGQVQGTGHTLYELVHALNGLNSPVYLVPRFHPRMRDEAPEVYGDINRAVRYFRNGELWPFTDLCSTSELVQAATIVVAEYSTVLVEAAAVRRVPIAMLYPAEGMRRFHQAMGDRVQEFPLVSLKCAVKAQTRGELVSLLARGLSGQLNQELASHQDHFFKLDGQNATRVAEFIQSLVQ